MQHRVVGISLWAVVLAAAGCLNQAPGPGTGGARTCAQLGWTCGADDTGASCGACPFSQACSSGTCVDPGAQVIFSGATAFALAGRYSGVLFSLPSAGTVRVTASSEGVFQVGVFTISDWTVFASGQQSGSFVLTNPTPSVTETISLPAGTFTLGFRCANTVGACTIRYAMTVTY